jgi:hypothetical protein
MIGRIGQTAIEMQGVYRRLRRLLAFASRAVGLGREVATGLALVEAMAAMVSIVSLNACSMGREVGARTRS